MLVAAGVGLAACGSGGGGASPVPAGGRSPAQGATVFGQHCATCHRSGGTGADLAALDPSASVVEDAVRNGRFQGGMPAFAGTLSDDQIQAVVDYVVTYKR